MERASTFALTLAVLLTSPTPAQSTTESTSAPVQPSIATEEAAKPEQVIHTDSTAMQALADWAIGRFSEARLDLPSIEIYFHENKEPCKGYSALHRRSEAGSRIDVCSLTRSPKLEATMLHELGHAWAAHNLTDQQRQAFVELQGLDAWYDKDASWNDRGTEQAAEIIAWGLREESRRPGTIPVNDVETLTHAFQQLTGTQPITDTSHEWQEGQPPTRTPAQSQPVEQLPAAVATYQAPMAGITVVGSDAERERVETAVAVFATLGMSLPNLEIRFWDDNVKCNGYLGWFSPSSLP
jgi:hypothetical protein